MALKDKVFDTSTGKHGLAARSTWKQEIPTGTVNGSNTNFTTSLTPINQDSTFLYLDSLIVPINEWSLVGSTITFNTAPVTGQKVYCAYLK